jgi:UDP-glucose 4-epimerase
MCAESVSRSRTALVTGGAGFIGGHIVERLVRDGWTVRVLDDFSSGHEENLSTCAEQIEVVRGDLCDPELIRRASEGAEVIFHEGAIASVSRSVAEPERSHAVNLSGTLGVLEAARRSGVRRVVFASSAAVYGGAAGLPRVESQAPACLSPYAVQKLGGEGYLAAYSELHDVETVALRYFNVYGPRQDPESDYAAAIPLFIRAALASDVVHVFGDGEQTRDFIYIDDIVEANVRAADAPQASGRFMNVASGKRTSVNDLLSSIGDRLGRELRISYEPERPGDIRHSWAGVERARELLGFDARVELAEGLATTIEDFAGRSAQAKHC